MMAWIRVKMAVVPPIPRASVRVAAAVNTGDIRNCLRLYRSVLRKFCIRLLPFPGGDIRNTPAGKKSYETAALPVHCGTGLAAGGLAGSDGVEEALIDRQGLEDRRSGGGGKEVAEVSGS